MGDNDCSAATPKNPCDLCVKRKACADIFVANKDGSFTCGSCIPLTSIDIEDPKVEVWEVGSDGWTDEISCCMCSEAIDVEVMPKISVDDIQADEDGDDYFYCQARHCGLRSWLEKDDPQTPGNTIACRQCGTKHNIT